ncbi:SDR family oxidoreductase [Pseudomonas aeruginosa]|nr:SDR family oxidoreductase [Pseudomonas aeruginosa]
MTHKRILVTGAGSGFGREVALRLAERGHWVIAGVRRAGQAGDLREEAGRRGGTLRVEVLDITVGADRERAWEWDVDVLLNNAGSAEAGASAEIPLELVRALFETNVFASLALTQGVVRRMVEQKRRGRVLFVSSIAGLLTGPYTGAYCASKHALEAFAEALHAELKPFGIQVGTINPGPYQTGFNDRMMETWKRWYDPRRHFTDYRGVRFPFEQHDPEEMIASMVALVEAADGPFRTLLPASFVEAVRQEQARAGERRL